MTCYEQGIEPYRAWVYGLFKTCKQCFNAIGAMSIKVTLYKRFLILLNWHHIVSWTYKIEVERYKTSIISAGFTICRKRID